VPGGGWDIFMGLLSGPGHGHGRVAAPHGPAFDVCQHAPHGPAGMLDDMPMRRLDLIAHFIAQVVLSDLVA
jgi:hypothetical protein